jgi:hypothetical protein
MKWYFYLDFGGGYTEVEATNINGLRLSLKKGEINDIIERKKIEGSITLIDTDSTAAKTYFVDNGNFECPIRIYENGDRFTGVLKYEGWVRKQGEYDFRRNQITLTDFRTNDQYEEFLKHVENKHTGENLIPFGNEQTSFAAQGQDTNANALHLLTFNGTDFNAQGSLSIPNLGKCSTTNESSEFIVFDPVNDTLKGYVQSGSSFTEQRSLSFAGTRFGYRADVVGIGSSQVRLVTDNGVAEVYQFSGTPPSGSFTAVPASDVNTPFYKNPKAAYDGTNLLIIDENTKQIERLGGQFTYSVGDVKNPDICVLDSATNAFAYIDSNLQKLVAFTFTIASGFGELGSIQLSGLNEPTITNYSAFNITLHDTISGKLEQYTYTGGGVWVQTGNTLSIGGGYTSSLAEISGNIMLAISDTYTFRCSFTNTYRGVIDGLLNREGIYGALAPNYELQSGTTSGSQVDVDLLVLGDMKDVSDNRLDAGSFNYFNYKLSTALKYFEDLFQNYWYIDSNYKVRFTQPNLFSSFGTSYDISALDLADQLNQRKYNDSFDISQEENIFLNAQNTEFRDNKIDYSRNTPIIQENNLNFTTDLQQLLKIFTGQINNEIERTGLIAYIKDNSLPFRTCASGTGIISASDTKNYLLSQSQLNNDYFKDYRYQEQGNITINGASSAVQDTVKNIIEFPEVRLSYEQLGITEFPDSVSNLTWDVGVVSFIVDFSVDMGTNEIIINSRLLDI